MDAFPIQFRGFQTLSDKPYKPTLQHRIEYALFVASGWLLQRIPKRFTRPIFRFVARLPVWFKWEKYGFSLVNIRIAFPDMPEVEVHRIARESFENFALNLIDSWRSRRWTHDHFREQIKLHGAGNMRQALEQGKGAFIVMAHLGNFELASQIVPLNFPNVAFLARPIRNRLVFDQLIAQRERTGAVCLGRTKVAPDILRALRKNGIVGILNDQYSKRARGVFVPFFGKRASTSAGLATLALRSGTPILPLVIKHVGGERLEVHISPPLKFDLTGDRKKDIEVITTVCNEALEPMIREQPEHYMWGHRRFRHSPDIEGNPYIQKDPRRKRGIW